MKRALAPPQEGNERGERNSLTRSSALFLLNVGFHRIGQLHVRPNCGRAPWLMALGSSSMMAIASGCRRAQGGCARDRRTPLARVGAWRESDGCSRGTWVTSPGAFGCNRKTLFGSRVRPAGPRRQRGAHES
jgi:hypothetical protein